MQSLSEKFLTRDERERVTLAVQAAEKTTSGEIVPMIVANSGSYSQATTICSVSLATPLALLLTHLVGQQLWLGPQNMYLFLMFFTLLFGGIYLFCRRTNFLHRHFLNNSQVEEEVSEGALAAFYGEGLYRTESENGILLYISVLEQRVWILADNGINKKIDQTVWDSIVSQLTLGIKEGRQCEALCEAVDAVGLILRDSFPYQRDDRDELHNLIIR